MFHEPQFFVDCAKKLLPLVAKRTETKIRELYTSDEDVSNVKFVLQNTDGDMMPADMIRKLPTEFYDHEKWLSSYAQQLQSDPNQVVFQKLAELANLEFKTVEESDRIERVIRDFLTSSMIETQYHQPADAEIGWSVANKMMQQFLDAGSNDMSEATTFYLWLRHRDVVIIGAGLKSIKECVDEFSLDL